MTPEQRITEQKVYYDTLRALRRNKRIHSRDARRFAYESSIAAREAAAPNSRKVVNG